MSNKETDAIVTTVRMRQHTIDQIEKLKNYVHAASFSEMIRRSVDISDSIIGAIKNGERVLIEDKKGNQRQILITGINGVSHASR
jgi:hypothetical protein